MEFIIIIPVVFISAFGLALFFKHSAKQKKEKLIAKYQFPTTIFKKVKEAYPHLSHEEVVQVITGLREYFYICNDAEKNMVAMPSQAVDVAWHEFILFTRQYESFCYQTFGRFLHHTPAEAMDSQVSAQEGIKLAWKLSCKRSKISAKKPKELPFLFALDSKLKIENGFKYSLNCMATSAAMSGTAAGTSFCASHIGCTSGCGGGFSIEGSGDGNSSADGGCGGGGGCGGS